MINDSAATWAEVTDDHRAVGTTLAAVEHALCTSIAELTCQWNAHAGDRAPILGTTDLPSLLAAAVGGGKQVRPAMVHWGWLAAGGPDHSRQQMITAGAAFELLHAFAIIHDDVMDRSETRRGHPTCHVLATEAYRQARGDHGAELFGDSIAILVGDLAHAEADHLIGALPSATRSIWRAMVIELVLGQRADLTGTSPDDRIAALEVARLKTGSYTIERPLQIGADLGAASASAMECLAGYGRHLGRAYGLRDDVLGTFGDPSRTGKSIDDDLTSGKQTVLLLLAEKRFSTDGRRRLRRVTANQAGSDEVDRVRQEMIDTGIRQEVEAMIDNEIDTALAALDRHHLDPVAVDGLTRSAEQLRRRTA